MNKKVCIIGGTGFIGTHLVDSLVNSGEKVIVLDRKNPPTVNFENSVEFQCADYSDNNRIESILKVVDEVICLAYTTSPKTSFDNPEADITSNLFPMANFLRVASKTKIKKILLVSSGGAIYGPAHKLPISEDHPTNPISPYGITKLAIEKYALMYHQTHDLPVIIVRPGNCYGPGQKPFTGQGFIATVIVSILTGKEISIFGQKGTIRDYIFISDLVNGILSALNSGKLGQCYNIGSGIGKNNSEVLEAIAPLAQASGLKIKTQYLAKRPFDVESNILDYKKLQSDSHWQPKISFGQGIKLTWEWLIKNYSK